MSDNIFGLIKDFVKKVKIDENEIKFKNGDIINEDQNTFGIYSSMVDTFLIKINKNIEKNTIQTIKNIFKTFQIKPETNIKSKLIDQLKNIKEIKHKFININEKEIMDDDEKVDEIISIDEMKTFQIDPYHEEYGITEDQARIMFNKLFIDWSFFKDEGDLKGNMKRKNLEYILKSKIKHKLSYFEKEGYPVIIKCKNKEDDKMEIQYKDGDGNMKKKIVDKINYQEYMEFLI
jgi:hypothetical protein